MSTPNIQLYEALKNDISEDAARMIAEVLPPAAELATKTDIHHLEARIDTLSHELEARTESLRHDIEARTESLRHDLGGRIDTIAHELTSRMDQLEARSLRWILGLFVPLWVAVLATLIAIVVQA